MGLPAEKSPHSFGNRTRRRQIHVWLSDREFHHLRMLAESRDETISALVRRVLRVIATRQTGTMKLAVEEGGNDAVR